MPVIVTRPREEAAQWAERLKAHGIDAVSLPLIQIGPAPDPLLLAQSRASLADYRAVMFVSANAVRGFFAGAGEATLSGARAWAPGPGTADALRQAGVPASDIDSPVEDATQFDSEALWHSVGGQVGAGFRLLIVRGAARDGRSAGRDWLREQVEGAGGQVAFVASYSRSQPAWETHELQVARNAAADGSTWLFSSSEAVSNLRALLPGVSWTSARAHCTHPRIAQAAVDAGFSRVSQSRPAFGDVLASLQSGQ